MFIDLLRLRRSIRQYRNQPVEKEKIDLLIEAALRAPSSRGFNPWEFVVVDDPETLAALSRSKPHGASFLANAPLAIAVCGEPATSDVWVEDVSIAAIILHLAAADLGLGSCWIQLRKRNYDQQTTAGQHAAHLLGLPNGLEVSAILAMGYPDQKPPPHPESALQREKVSFNRHGRKT
jgi:nitroreductase